MLATSIYQKFNHRFCPAKNLRWFPEIAIAARGCLTFGRRSNVTRIFRQVTMVNRIAGALPSNDVLRGSAGVMTIKLTASLLGFAMFALSSRHMDPAAFGTLAVIFNAMSFVAVVSLCGQETLIVRSWDEYCQSHRFALARG